VLAESTSSATQEVKTVAVTGGLVALALSVPKVHSRFYSFVDATVKGSGHSDSLLVRADKGNVLVQSEYAGQGPHAFHATVDDVNVAVLFGFAIDSIHASIDASPAVTTSISGGVQLHAPLGEIHLESKADGRLLSESSQVDFGMLDANAVAHLDSSAKPAVTVLLGQHMEYMEGDIENPPSTSRIIDDGTTSLQGNTITVRSQSQLDAATRVKQASYSIIATTGGTAKATVMPSIEVALA
jgi:hypothetical protein